jgi:hypothetical protein
VSNITTGQVLGNKWSKIIPLLEPGRTGDSEKCRWLKLAKGKKATAKPKPSSSAPRPNLGRHRQRLAKGKKGGRSGS